MNELIWFFSMSRSDVKIRCQEDLLCFLEKKSKHVNKGLFSILHLFLKPAVMSAGL